MVKSEGPAFGRTLVKEDLFVFLYFYFIELSGTKFLVWRIYFWAGRWLILWMVMGFWVWVLRVLGLDIGICWGFCGCVAVNY
jgi:hypothetical protein